MAARDEFTASADHGGFHCPPPPAAAAADAVADHRKERLLELGGDGTITCRNKVFFFLNRGGTITLATK